MAEAWKAKAHGAHDFERVVVLKRILPHLCRDRRFVEMFVSEARLSARLSHPNIVQVFDFGEHDGEYFLAMEFIEGLTLSAVVDRMMPPRPVPIGLAVQVVRDIGLALNYAHALTGSDGTPLHIVHRDVSPSNVMLGLDGTVKLLDFGVAKAIDLTKEQTRSGIIKGKVSYMAPEVVDGTARADARTDLFAAGVVLHELLTGRRLFRGQDEFETIALVRACEVEAPSYFRSEIPAALDEVCLKALSRQPEKRFQTGAELVAALAPFLHDLRWDTVQTAALVGELARTREDPRPETATSPLDSIAATPRLPAPAVREQRKKKLTLTHLIVATALALVAGIAAGWQLASRTTAMRSGLIVASDPDDAKVELDGQLLPQTTPTTIANIAPGEHTVRLHRVGHADVERRVRVRAGERAMLQIALPNASHRVSVTTAPAAATVYLDGTTVLGSTPTFVTVTDDDFHQLRIERAGYETLTFAITPENRKPELSFALEPEREARGTLSVEADGLAQVWLDGVYTGYDTPTMGFRVAVGEHTVQLRDSVNVLSAPTRVTIRQGEFKHLMLTLKKP